jgi:hypothetical protein
MNSPTSLFVRLLQSLAVFWLLLVAMPAQAYPVDQCAADRFGSNLNCTAKDVQITGMKVVGDITTCVGGAQIALDLEMTMNFGSPDRYDIGVFIANDGKDPQFRSSSGGAATCSTSVLPTASPFLNLNSNTCGDGNGSIGGNTGRGIHYMANVSVPCQAYPGSGGKLYIPFVVVWDHQASSVCSTNADPVPGTSSKCNSPTILQGSIDVVVLPSISKSDNRDTAFSNTNTTYTVTVTNTTGASLSGLVFRDPAVSGIAVSGISCSHSGASCPTVSVAAMQGAGITLPTMPHGSSITFTIPATLTGTPGTTLTNTALVTTGAQTNTASDSTVIVYSIYVSPPTQSKTGDKGATVSYTYTVHNYGFVAETVNLSVASSRGWAVTRSPTSVLVPAGGSADVTVTVAIPNSATVGTVDTTTLTAYGTASGKTASATALTTVTDTLSLVPSNTGTGGAGTFVYYSHRVQNNANSSRSVSLTPSFTAGTCTGWSHALYETDKTTTFTSPVTLAGNGGYKDFLLRVAIPGSAAVDASCTASLVASMSGASNVTVTDVTTVKRLMLYEDAAFSVQQDTFPTENRVYAQTFGLTPGVRYHYEFLNPSGTVVCRDPSSGTTLNVGATWKSQCDIPAAGPLGTWTARIIQQGAAAGTYFASEPFYVGPDHIAASYSGPAPTTNTNTVIDLAMHTRTGNVVPKDALNNLVQGSPSDLEGPLMITVTLSGSAEVEIVATTLENYTISGQTITGRLSSTTGTATLTIRSATQQTVTITPASYKGKLVGSTARDVPVSVSFWPGGPHHYRIEHASGSGITCVPSSLTVKACANDDCSSLYMQGATGTLTKSGTPTVNWPSGAGFAIPSGSGSVVVPVHVTTAGSVVFGMTNPVPAASNAMRCNFGAPQCTFVSNLAGFVFNVPDHYADVEQTITVSAVRQSDSSLACTPAFASVSRSLSFSCAYADPATGTLPVSVGGTNVACGSSSSIPLSFNSSGVATTTVRYADVGQINLTASYTGSGSEAGLVMTGSDPFITAPSSFSVTPVGPYVAGQPFSVTVTALNASGNPTPNFGKESTAEHVNLTHTLTGPVGGNNPALAGTTTLLDAAFSAGGGSATTSDLTWGEVGDISLVATLAGTGYLGTSLGATGSQAAGPFRPAYFETVVTPATDTFTYSGQPMPTARRTTAGRWAASMAPIPSPPESSARAWPR